MTYSNKPVSQWTREDHAAYNRDALAQKLRTAQHNGYRTIEEYENAHNWAARAERRWGV
jgi:hypothetical protein